MYKLLLCLRYLKTRYIALASIISVMLGVATMIVVNSVMSGFSYEMKDRIRGILSDVIIETYNPEGIHDLDKYFATINKHVGDEIESMTATVEQPGLMSYPVGDQRVSRFVTMIGIKPWEKDKVSPLRKSLRGRNPLTEDGKVVREAIHDPDKPLDWNLSKQAMERRKRKKELELALRGGPGAKVKVPGKSPRKSGEKPPFEEKNGGKNEEPPFADPMGDDKTGAKEPDPGIFDSLPSGTASPDPPVFPDRPKSIEDAAKPLRGRVYVGLGLISYPQEDPKTGKVRTKMLVQPGDDVILTTVTSGSPPKPVHFDVTVVDVFRCGMSEYDSNIVYVNLDFFQDVRGMVKTDPDTGKESRAVTSVQIKLKDYSKADEVVKKLRGVFPAGAFQVRTWEQKQGPLLAAVEVESAILNVLLFLIIAVAGFGILAIFFMIVVEKTRDIGILKALGASSKGVMSVFMSYGLALGLVGGGVGVCLGLLFVNYINEVEGFMTWMTGRKVFDEKIYYFPEIPTSVSPTMVFWVAFGAVAIAVLASILPARRASRLHPVESLRYE